MNIEELKAKYLELTNKITYISTKDGEMVSEEPFDDYISALETELESREQRIAELEQAQVEIVRCGECIFYDEDNEGTNGEARYFCDSVPNKQCLGKKSFCSFGVRKEVEVEG